MSGGMWELDDLATASDIAAELHASNTAVCTWAERYDDFPAPLCRLAGTAVYSLTQVRCWYAQQWPERAVALILARRAQERSDRSGHTSRADRLRHPR